MNRQQETLFPDLHREPMAAPLAAARAADPPSSHAAAERMNETGKAKDHAELISAVLARGGGWTSYEIAKETGLTNVQVSRRLSGMMGVKRADDSLARVCRVCKKKLATYWDRAIFEGGEDD